ncbi:alpha/beta hydrolase [Streptomyces sp. TP-A0874]|uniref:alpha/beta hydrolase n=1 Tax=Streptomyces sp. TP-A0874 TaxID=549819 RepID=UPI00085338E6|nr:alpha/beta hydrolase [Streptomyces sp. TP-A0874]
MTTPADTDTGPATATAADEERRLLALEPRPPRHSARYGPHPSQVIDYYLPGAGRPPTARVTVLHGGFWREAYDRTHLSPLADALARTGMAVALAEYRRVGGGGGWPETFQDAARVAEVAWPMPAGPVVGDTGGEAATGEIAAWQALEAEAEAVGVEHVVLGHSAGGQLALWLAARPDRPASTGADPGPGRDAWSGGGGTRRVGASVSRAVAVAPVADLAVAHGLKLSDGAVAELLGGQDQLPARLLLADPMALLPPRVPVTLLHGAADPDVPVELSRRYTEAARAASARAEVENSAARGIEAGTENTAWADGGRVFLRELPGGGHYGPLIPGSDAFAVLLEALRPPYHP